MTEDLGTIEVVFPENVPEEDALNFEKIMVYNGFLKTGLVAGADDLGKKIAETASNVASYLSGKTDERNENAPTREKDTEYSDVTKGAVASTEAGAKKVAEGSAVAGKAIS